MSDIKQQEIPQSIHSLIFSAPLSLIPVHHLASFQLRIPYTSHFLSLNVAPCLESLYRSNPSNAGGCNPLLWLVQHYVCLLNVNDRLYAVSLSYSCVFKTLFRPSSASVWLFLLIASFSCRQRLFPACSPLVALADCGFQNQGALMRDNRCWVWFRTQIICCVWSEGRSESDSSVRRRAECRIGILLEAVFDFVVRS